MGKVDLDAARAARSEAQRETHTVVFGGDKYTLPPRISVRAVSAAMDGDMLQFLKVLLGEQFDAFMAEDPDDLDLQVLAEGISDIYGVAVGESEASGESSTTTTKRSRPTSGGAAKTSAKSSGATRT